MKLDKVNGKDYRERLLHTLFALDLLKVTTYYQSAGAFLKVHLPFDMS